MRALEAGTSVNALLRQYLVSYVGTDAMAARQAIVAMAQANLTDVGPHSWDRDDLHAR